MTDWFTSDHHLSHKLVAGLRGFDDLAAHDAMLAKKWDKVIRPNNRVWLLGDLCLGGTETTERALQWVADRPGEKILILGNHDKPQEKNGHKWMRRYHEVFVAVFQHWTVKIAGQEVWLSHYPFSGDHTREDRFNGRRLRDEGNWLLHGHTHSSERRSGPKSIHVGLDAWSLAPVPLSEIEKMIR